MLALLLLSCSGTACAAITVSNATDFLDLDDVDKMIVDGNGGYAKVTEIDEDEWTLELDNFTVVSPAGKSVITSNVATLNLVLKGTSNLTGSVDSSGIIQVDGDLTIVGESNASTLRVRNMNTEDGVSETLAIVSQNICISSAVVDASASSASGNAYAIRAFDSLSIESSVVDAHAETAGDFGESGSIVADSGDVSIQAYSNVTASSVSYNGDSSAIRAASTLAISSSRVDAYSEIAGLDDSLISSALRGDEIVISDESTVVDAAALGLCGYAVNGVSILISGCDRILANGASDSFIYCPVQGGPLELSALADSENYLILNMENPASPQVIDAFTNPVSWMETDDGTVSGFTAVSIRNLQTTLTASADTVDLGTVDIGGIGPITWPIAHLDVQNNLTVPVTVEIAGAFPDAFSLTPSITELDPQTSVNFTIAVAESYRGTPGNYTAFVNMTGIWGHMQSVNLSLSIVDMSAGTSTQTPTPPLTLSPTEMPTQEPTEAPTEAPTEPPTEAPTEAPTEPPTEAPTEEPTDPPTEAPTEGPTEPLTESPTEGPTDPPTEAPTEGPTEPPTEAPTEGPTEPPTEAPTEGPTEPPTEEPTEAPTESPTETPTVTPTRTHTQAPTHTSSYGGDGTRVVTYTPTVSPTAELVSVAIPEVKIPVAHPSPRPTQESPVPVAGIIAGMAAACLILSRR